MEVTMGIEKIKSGRTSGAVCAAFLVLLTAVACSPMTMKEDTSNSTPESQDPDWGTLRAAVKQYEASRADMEQRTLLIAQNKFRDLTDRHSNDRIGDEALYYIGRIYYDMRDYHDARLTFIRHKEYFRNSEFASTIAQIEKEMDADTERYHQWLEESRAASSVVR